MKDIDKGGPMKVRFISIGIISLFLALSLNSCGGSGPGSPSSEGSEDTGVNLTITAVNHSDAGFGDQGDGWDVDIIQDLCDPGPPPDFEPFGNDFAAFTFRGTPLDPDVPVGDLHIRTYRVEYFPQDPGAPSMERLNGFNSFTIQPTGDDIISGNFLILDVGRKTKVAQDILSGEFSPQRIPVIYDMQVTLEGVDDFDNAFKLLFQRTIDLANFDNC
jgi:hypothetical protein